MDFSCFIFGLAVMILVWFWSREFLLGCFMSKVRVGNMRFGPDCILMGGGATGANKLI